MPKVTIDVAVDEIRKLLPHLSPDQVLKLDHEIHDYLETHIMMMSAAETSFAEWASEEEDI